MQCSLIWILGILLESIIDEVFESYRLVSIAACRCETSTLCWSSREASWFYASKSHVISINAGNPEDGSQDGIKLSSFYSEQNFVLFHWSHNVSSPDPDVTITWIHFKRTGFYSQFESFSWDQSTRRTNYCSAEYKRHKAYVVIVVWDF